ncbi:DeoR/GlpR transcriptional regulator [Paenibacillus psychroresistens]|uniref:DeoR/GlpR transcriptional regulator n=1 Tax=Paenibacillus psychroresistens TaxID=1778678 RepID=A0A6B8RMA0_9BACL|nr:DeoR/GlpR family DNA-binding transcription regulator [Paenibacillus psychroresistens]QGQ97521.1 DeoR/GlpR transcriptional regulator [Paenibacillus psychroresistens]
MYASQRRKEILKITKERNYISVAELHKLFDVSEVTIRADLRNLETAGEIERNYGGATIKDIKIPPFSEVTMLLNDAKELIAQTAAGLIQNGDSLFLDASTTTLLLSAYVAEIDNLTVISNSIPIFHQLKEYNRGTLIGIPGALNPITQSFVGPIAEQMIENLRVRKAFIAPKGILPEGLRDHIMLEAAIRKKMIDSADEVIVLADHSKFTTKQTIFNIASFDVVTTVVTDRDPGSMFKELFQAKGIKLLIAEK